MHRGEPGRGWPRERSAGAWTLRSTSGRRVLLGLGLVLLSGLLLSQLPTMVGFGGPERVAGDRDDWGAGSREAAAGSGATRIGVIDRAAGANAVGGALGTGLGADALALRGAGRRSRLACMLCVGVFLGIAGTSVAGIVAAAVAFPEFAAACGVVCGIGYA